MSFEEKIDTNLYSRQIGTFGFDMMGKLQKLNVLIIGMKSTGIEIGTTLLHFLFIFSLVYKFY